MHGFVANLQKELYPNEDDLLELFVPTVSGIT